ncbi:MAG: hypothetical protein QF704_05435 [Anaerolineales bacterium]|jgi:hypothetical protein|nr:hypothetical protein [Anaerolineales bacterium]MDP6770122.1 hypothetical protein [Anaerolineales bacterium]|tara:strand:+ start:414 stop:602 length:189 start_codon:yes stop_codon:yes gene_type:complete
MAKQEWQVIDSESSVMRDHKKILYRAKSLQEAVNWRNANHPANWCRIRTKPEANRKQQEETI